MDILLAVSGGIDSMYLANRASDLFPGARFGIAHCNFHLRGEESDGDAAFVEQWSREHGLRFFRKDFDTLAYAEQHHVSTEMAARELRYTWFAELCRTEAYDALALAHNANDNAETLILNLLRGTGSKGMRGMARSGKSAEGITLLRPMLDITREQIRNWMVEGGHAWREDSTNATCEYKRNIIRNEAFPIFERINPSFIRTLNEDMRRIAQADDIAQDYAAAVGKRIRIDDNSFSINELLSVKHWPFVLHDLLEPFAFSTETLGKLVALLESGGTVSGKTFQSPTHLLLTTQDTLVVSARGANTPDSTPVVVDAPGEYECNGRRIVIDIFDYQENMPLKQPEGTIIVDEGRLPMPLTLRAWHDGDWMCPLGMGGKKRKLSDIFSDMKLAASKKAAAVVAVASLSDKHVMSVLGLRIDEGVKVTPATRKVLRIKLF